jgi:uncharacterized protein YndB with AHSA1/START domain
MTVSEMKNTTVGALVITRTFDAPRERVWYEWTDRQRAKKWGPKGFTTREREMDFRVGGAWHAVLVSEDGKTLRQHGVVRELVPLERLAFTFVWDDEPDEEMLVAVTFSEHGGRTTMTFRQDGFASAESRKGHEGGWNEAFDRLAENIEGA